MANRREQGAASVEYVAIAALVALIVIAGVAALVASPPGRSTRELGEVIGRRIACAPRYPVPCGRNPLALAYGFPLGKLVRQSGTDVLAEQPLPVDFRLCRRARAAPGSRPGLTASRRRVTVFTSVEDLRPGGGQVRVSYWLYRPTLGWTRIVRTAGAAEVAAASRLRLNLEDDPALVPLETLAGRNHYDFPRSEEPPWRWRIPDVVPGGGFRDSGFRGGELDPPLDLEREMRLGDSRSWSSGPGRWLALCTAAAIAFFLHAGQADAGAYEVVECYPTLNASAPDAEWASSDSAYTHGLDCSRGDGWGAYTRLTESWAQQGTSAAWHFYAPAGTVFRSGSFHYRSWNADGASGNVALYGPVGSAQSWGPSDERQVSFGPSQGNHLVAGLYCANGGGCLGDASSYGYGQGYWNLVQIRYLHLELLDSVDPLLALSGSITEGGYHQGTETLEIAATDQGGGPRGATVSVNGERVADLDNPGCSFIAGGDATRFVPCPPRTFSAQLDTDGPPFVDGENSLEACVHDVSTPPDIPRSSCERRTILVGEPPPSDVDTDGDGCSDAAEAAMGTDPGDADTDDDGLGDCDEAAAHSCLSPLNRDSDNDGLLDGADPEPCACPAPAAGGVAGERSGIPTLADCSVRVVGSQRKDRLSGSKADDRLLGRGGNDAIRDMGGRNCLLGNRGNDRLRAAPSPIRLIGGPGRDGIAARDGVRDLVKCGAGRADRARVDRIDLVTGCERLVRR